MGRNFSQMTPEQRAECGRRGGIASGEAKRRKKEAKNVIETFLTMPLKKGKVADVQAIKNFMELKGKNITVEEAMHLQLMQKALKGDYYQLLLLQYPLSFGPNYQGYSHLLSRLHLQQS